MRRSASSKVFALVTWRGLWLPAGNLERCELTHLDRQPIDVSLAIAQHNHYQSVLAELGCHIVNLPPATDLPDSVFQFRENKNKAVFYIIF